MFPIYTLLYGIAAFVLLTPHYFRRPGGMRNQWLGEKLGLFDLAGPDASCIWVHAVSVGEVNASLSLLVRLTEAFPGVQLILSTVTDTGRKVALERAPDGTKVIYIPFDLPVLLRRPLRKIRLMAFITIETEIWPNIFRIMDRQNVPVFVLNGRISDKSFRGYKMVSFFMRRVLSHVRAFGVQGRADAERFAAIGADPKRIQIVGNFKFDLRIGKEPPPWTAALKGPIIVAGSTHSGEEALILSAYKESAEAFPDLNLVLAPRHPERFKEVESLLKAEEIPFVKRSAFDERPPFERAGGKIVLLDIMGELPSVYGSAEIAIMGKSFFAEGGQNPLEPAYWGNAIICGPHMENFSFIRDFYAAGAAFEVAPGALPLKLQELLLSPEKRRAAGQKARALCLENSGAVEMAIEILKANIAEVRT